MERLARFPARFPMASVVGRRSRVYCTLEANRAQAGRSGDPGQSRTFPIDRRVVVEHDAAGLGVNVAADPAGRIRPASCRARIFSSTARSDAPPTAASTGMPATAAFCTSSKLAWPLTSRTPSTRGVRPVFFFFFFSLSRALCRPTSSRTCRSRPSGSNSAAACRPPVRSKAPCAPRSVVGSRRMTLAATAGRPAIGADRGRTSTASSDALPQTPQLEAA